MDHQFVLVFKDGTRHEVQAKEHIGAIARYILEGGIPARAVDSVSSVEEAIASPYGTTNANYWNSVTITDNDRMLVRDVLIEYLLRKL